MYAPIWNPYHLQSWFKVLLQIAPNSIALLQVKNSLRYILRYSCTAQGSSAACIQICSLCVQVSSRVCTCIPYWRALSGGRCRSSSSSSLIVSRTRLSTVGDRAFPVAAARVWNTLPAWSCHFRTFKLRCLSICNKFFVVWEANQIKCET